MKKAIIIILLALPVTLSAVQWSPSAALSVEYAPSTYSAFANENVFWNAFRSSVSLNPLSITISGHHSLSLPFEAGYISDSDIRSRMLIPGKFEARLSLRYGYITGNRVEFALSPVVSLLYHIDQRALSWRFGGNFSIVCYPLDHLGIAFPFTLLWSRGSLHAETGISIIIKLRGII